MEAELREAKVHWRDKPVLPTKLAAEIAGVSIASLYRQSKLGNLQFKTVAGRTMIETNSLINLLDNAVNWTPQSRTNAATAKRAAKRARAKAE